MLTFEDRKTPKISCLLEKIGSLGSIKTNHALDGDNSYWEEKTINWLKYQTPMLGDIST